MGDLELLGPCVCPLPVVSLSPRPEVRTTAHFRLMVRHTEMGMELLLLVFTLKFFEGKNKCTLGAVTFFFILSSLCFLKKKKKNKTVLLTISLIGETRASRLPSLGRWRDRRRWWVGSAVAGSGSERPGLSCQVWRGRHLREPGKLLSCTCYMVTY